MSVTYNIVQRPNPRAPQAPKKFYPSILSSGRVTMRDLAVMAAQRSTISTMDVMAVIEGFLAIIPEQLAKGNIVELGDFGRYRLTAGAAGVETEEEVSIAQIKGLMARFRPGKQFKKELKGIEFVRQPKLPEPEPVPPAPEP